MCAFMINWVRMMHLPIFLGLLGLMLIAAGCLWQQNMINVMGLSVLCFSGILASGRYAHRKDCMYIADYYLLVRQRNVEYIFHARDIQEIIYGKKVSLKLSKNWFDLGCFRESKVAQYALVQFGVLNGISVHAAGFVCPSKGRYARTKISRQL